MPDRTALVTGGAGFIGSHLVDHLRDHDYTVVVMDNLFRGRLDNLGHRRGDPQTITYLGDIRDRSAVQHVFASFRPSAVFHLAAVAFIPYNVAHPAETLEVNVVGTQNLLEAAATNPPHAFICASTADVYVPQEPSNKENQPVGSYNIYGISKQFCERLLALAGDANPAGRFFATRFFNVYGNRETNPHIIPEVVDQAVRGDAEIVIGNLWPKRDYVYVADVVDALRQVAEKDNLKGFDVFNIGTGIEYSVQEVIDVVGKILGRPIKAKVDPARTRPVERDHLLADVSKIRQAIGWQARYTLEQGLRELVETLAR